VPTGIVTTTCPAPKCNLADQDIHCFIDEMRAHVEMFEPAFRWPEQLEWSKNYLQGLPGDASHKNKDFEWEARLREQIMKYNVLDFSNWKDESELTRKVAKLVEWLNLFYKEK
jgi:hypothetical protein